MTFKVLKPGLQTTVQAGPRTGLRHLGVPASGAADPLSLALANRLVGNASLAPGIETTLTGVCVLFEKDGFAAPILKDTVVWLVPVVNPDGLHRFLEVSSHLGRKDGREHERPLTTRGRILLVVRTLRSPHEAAYIEQYRGDRNHRRVQLW